MVSSYPSQSFGPSTNNMIIKLHQLSYLKATYNTPTIYRMYEKKTALNFTSLCSIMNYFVSLENVKIIQVQVWLVTH